MLFYLGVALMAALAIHCLWEVVKALRHGIVESPSGLSFGTTRRADAPVSYWLQVAAWIAGAGVSGHVVMRAIL